MATNWKELLEKIKSLEMDYEGALSDISELKERIKLLEEVCGELMDWFDTFVKNKSVHPNEYHHYTRLQMIEEMKKALESARQKLGEK